MALLYKKDGKMHNSEYCELYIPISYFKDGTAINAGATVNVFGVLYIRGFPKGKEMPIQLLNIPTAITINSYDTDVDEIDVKGKSIKVNVYKYIKDSPMFSQFVPQGREIAEVFLSQMLDGKLPNVHYLNIMDMWWNNLEIAGVSHNIPSKHYEMIAANVYRDPHDIKKRFGEYFGKMSDPDGYSYKTQNVRDVVENISTFSALIYEDINRMMTTGINNAIEGVEEPISPLEKIMSY